MRHLPFVNFLIPIFLPKFSKIVQIHINSRSFQRSVNYKSSIEAVISINNVDIKLNQSYAVTISEKCYAQYLLDNCLQKINIEAHV